MKKLTVLLLVVFCSYFSYSQSLYKGFEYNMSKKAAYKEFKLHKSDYTNIQLGNGVNWRMYKQNLHIYNNLLKGIILVPKGSAFGLSSSSGEVYLNNTFKFLVNKGYKVWFQPDNWNIPILFDQHSKYGTVLIHPDKTTSVELRPKFLPATNNYTVMLVINNYENFISGVDTEFENAKKKQDNTGF
ncbi:hypothetical protein K5X82_07270 [Halosquirtibacter xylanolyticus]|uniref:hypothetical protein n=1 Tax=Halosquirtibacter xylanolyticus TaxID=3374599 RepID=UPI0037495489|nr:hypothetical protein K5X82_07270 [Prolixibacteraceae bacterium]